MQDKSFIADYLPYLLARASHGISAEFHARAKAAGLGVAEWRVLATLSNGRPITIGQLARDVLFQQPTLTKIIDRMETDGLVARVTANDDRRQRLVEISAKGRRLVRPLLAAARHHETVVLARIGPKAAIQLKRVLHQLLATAPL